MEIVIKKHVYKIIKTQNSITPDMVEISRGGVL